MKAPHRSEIVIPVWPALHGPSGFVYDSCFFSFWISCLALSPGLSSAEGTLEPPQPNRPAVSIGVTSSRPAVPRALSRKPFCTWMAMPPSRHWNNATMRSCAAGGSPTVARKSNPSVSPNNFGADWKSVLPLVKTRAMIHLTMK